ncbi:AMP-binding protein [Cupriavidus necator]|uniref:AMP-dependent synthetase/ligase domain-containing protein n=1 Tax=Cupriavidus necator TaxID=106590 RepID=A0A367PJM6_CUPNE|nr:AMP-binding protein [Cupriavidus necator]QQX82815.1 AMP-binding protein [Cupriavidus necator]RCJ07447.1 hypothetical protein DDK22_15805 [Cupriavidus necator]
MSSNPPQPACWPAGVPLAKGLTGCALFRHLEALAEARPDAIAAGHATYRELLDASLTLAGYMQQRLGIRAGDQVLLLMEDNEPFAIACFAIARCDAVAVAVAPQLHDDSAELARLAAAHDVHVAIARAAALPAVAPLLDDGTLYGCIVDAGPVSARPGVHDLAGALSAGIAPVPLPASQ